jgi:2-dehydropantoate 2-reductase
VAAHGFRISEGTQTISAPPTPAAESVHGLPGGFHQPDLAILCVKSYDTSGALPALHALAPRLVLTLQNGIGNEETLAEALGKQRVLSGVITSSTIVGREAGGPAIVTVTKSGGVGLAGVGYGGADAAMRWATIFGDSGLNTRSYGDYRAMKWSKALLNMMGNGAAAILGMTVDQLYADDRLVALDQRAGLEALATMRALGIRPLNLPGYPAALLALLLRRLPTLVLYPLLRRVVAGGRGGKQPSLLGDMQRGSARSEGEVLYGAVARNAATVGMATPVNTTIWQILGDISSGRQRWDTYVGQPGRLLSTVAEAELSIRQGSQ